MVLVFNDSDVFADLWIICFSLLLVDQVWTLQTQIALIILIAFLLVSVSRVVGRSFRVSGVFEDAVVVLR
jgi:hypothetical protein